MICLAFVTAPNRQGGVPNAVPTSPREQSLEAQQAAAAAPAAQAGNSEFAAVHRVIDERCTVCHAAQPSSPLFSAAPAGVMFDTPEQIRLQAAKIHAQAVASQIMPLGNMTNMTQEERDLLGAWIDKGAPID